MNAEQPDKSKSVITPIFSMEKDIKDACMITGAIADGLVWYLPRINQLNKKKDAKGLMQFIEQVMNDMRMAYAQTENSMELIENPEVMERHGVTDVSASLPSREELFRRTHAHLCGIAMAILASEVSSPAYAVDTLYRITPEVSKALNEIKQRVDAGEYDAESMPQLVCTAKPGKNETTGHPEVVLGIGVLSEESDARIEQEGERLWQALEEIKQSHQPKA